MPFLFTHEDRFEHWGELLEDARKGLNGQEDSRQRFERLIKWMTQPPNGSTPASLATVFDNLTVKEYVRNAATAESKYLLCSVY